MASPGLLVIFWWMLHDGVAYHELDPDFLAGRHDPDRRRRRLIDQLQRLGYHVELTPPPGCALGSGETT